MKFSLSQKARYLTAVVAGLFLAASFPKFNVAGLAWIAPGLLLCCAQGQGSGACFRMGYLAGLAHFLASLYWLLFIPFPAGAIVGWVALSAYLALFPATWLWLCWRFVPTIATIADRQAREREAVPPHRAPPLEPVPWPNWWRRSLWTMLCAVIWVALEIIVGRFLSGFPWNFLGVSQYRVLPLIQVASVAGVYAVSFLVVWFSTSLAMVALRLADTTANRWAWLGELRLALGGLAVIAAFGMNRVLRLETPPREITLALVQPSIRQEVIWDHTKDADRFDALMELSRRALVNRPDVLIWPEAALPDLSEENFRAITNLIATHKVWMIFGADDEERRSDPTKPDEYDSFNAAFLLTPEGRLAATYRKLQLVMFGEYVPFARRLPLLRKLIPVPGDFTPGTGPVPFHISHPRAKLAVVICFEDVFPHRVRHYVADDTDFLLNLTNDGWFGESAAQWQQAANAVFRAVENGLPLVRCTNNGLTCWIDSRGRVRDVLGQTGKAVYAPGFTVLKVPLLADGARREPTFYNRHGDWFGWGCLVVAVCACVVRFSAVWLRSAAG